MFVADAADVAADAVSTAALHASFGRLFAKPDDVWDVNDLSRSLHEDRARLCELLCERLVAAGRASTSQRSDA